MPLGDVFEIPGLQPSGKYATAEDNSLRNLIMMMYSWYSREETKDVDFFSQVLPRTYGDDFIYAIKEEYLIHFNTRVS